ncbi:PREDICTED: olfactory receptor-like protein OLF4 [Cyprinodon variegatus]|uniref:olfactory receptor-like protein OLF4 n=1 Tax=Cyprinodon variegatus TaxID=28743 RepID=UPI0007426C8C|nr:PREDICTED: olfactory receptor-like protein OLF4 [Cyprinodon variegatus]
MSFINQSQANTTLGVPQWSILGYVLFSTVTTLPSCVFLFINLTMLYTLRSKEVFVETSRYILLFNLLFADTVQLAQSQSMFLLSTTTVTMLYSVCVGLIIMNSLTLTVSIVTLIIMCLERYIAVCYPFRHSVFMTTKNTGVVICIIWCFSTLKSIMQLSLIFKFSLRNLNQVQYAGSCGKQSVYEDPVSDVFTKAFTYFLCVLGGVTVTFSYTGIMVAARTASTNAASAKKAQRTLLLHLLQMGLTVSSTIYNSLLIVLSKIVDRFLAVHLQIVVYICIIIFPKCLSSLIYGLRDRTIRPILVLNLICQWRSWGPGTSHCTHLKDPRLLPSTHLSDNSFQKQVTFLVTCHVPTCFKSSTIIPVPNKPKPVTLTYVVMKSFELLALSNLKEITDPLSDPLQFAYRANRSADDAVNLALYYILQHLDSAGS